MSDHEEAKGSSLSEQDGTSTGFIDAFSDLYHYLSDAPEDYIEPLAWVLMGQSLGPNTRNNLQLDGYVVWVLLLSPPGGRRTAVINRILKPLLKSSFKNDEIEFVKYAVEKQRQVIQELQEHVEVNKQITKKDFDKILSALAERCKEQIESSRFQRFQLIPRGTPEGVMKYLEGHPMGLWIWDEFGLLMKHVKKGSGYLANFGSFLIAIYDGFGFEFETKTAPKTNIPNSYVSTIFSIQTKIFKANLTDEFEDQGVLRRLIMKNVRSFQRKPRKQTDPKIREEKRSKVQMMLEFINGHNFDFTYDTEGYEQMFSEVDQLMGDREALQGVEEYWLKIAAFLALDKLVGRLSARCRAGKCAVSHDEGVGSVGYITIEVTKDHLQRGLEKIKAIAEEETVLLKYVATKDDQERVIGKIKRISEEKGNGATFTPRDIYKDLDMEATRARQILENLKIKGIIEEVPLTKDQYRLIPTDRADKPTDQHASCDQNGETDSRPTRQ